jgi:16S rRNA (adenine1518-N6/adenine1519-N6)-dimethyltransferase
MTLSEIRQILSEHRLQLTKSLGQNFLHDQNQLRKIVAAAELAAGDKVLEIGPGLGPLTELLLQSAGEVLAIEKDARLVEILKQRFVGQAACLSLIHADALEFLRRERRDWSNWKLVSNLPYSAASPILVELSQAPRGPQRIVTTLQIEVARRLAARSGDPDYGLLTLLVQLDYEPCGFFKIPAGCFFPEPEVDSACVCLVRRPQPLLELDGPPIFIQIVKLAFSQRRKMMLKLLKSRWPVAQVDHAFRLAGISPQSRAESVSLEQFVKLARALAQGSKVAHEVTRERTTNQH